MKNSKISFPVIALALGIAASAFTAEKQSAFSTAGWYGTKSDGTRELIVAQSQPSPAPDLSANCTGSISTLCAAFYDVNGMASNQRFKGPYQP